MVGKPSYEDLEQRISELESEVKRYAVQKNDDKYRLLFEKFKDAILIIENEKFIDCNQAAVDMLGHKNKTQLFLTHPSEISPNTQPDGKDSFAKSEEMMGFALKNGSHIFEWDHIRANGEVFSVEVLLTTISHKRDKRIYYILFGAISPSANRKRMPDKKRKKRFQQFLKAPPMELL